MNIEEYREYCIAKKGVTESMPFKRNPDILVFKVKGKIFTATDINDFDGFTIKCEPEIIDDLKASYNCLVDPPYANKNHWCEVKLDNTVKVDKLYEWLDKSYDLVVAKLPKYMQKELFSL